MVVLGLLLVLAALAAGVLAVYGLPTSGAKISWDLLGNSVSLSPTLIFFIGVLSAIALALGLWLMSLGAKRNARKRRELKELRREQRHSERIGQADRGRRDETRRDTSADPRTGTARHDEVRDTRDTDTARDTRDVRDGGAARNDRADGATSWDDTRR